MAFLYTCTHRQTKVEESSYYLFICYWFQISEHLFPYPDHVSMICTNQCAEFKFNWCFLAPFLYNTSLYYMPLQFHSAVTLDLCLASYFGHAIEFYILKMV